MTLFQKLGRLFSRKDSVSRQLIAINASGRPISTPRRYDQFAEEGYRKNVIVYKCIWLIANACASIPWVLYRKAQSGNSRREEITSHPFFDLLGKPNPFQSSSEFEEAIHAFKLISGNSYIEAVGPAKNRITELHNWRPDRTRVILAASGYPGAYEYTVGSTSRQVQVDAVSGRSPILQLKSFNPLDDTYGMAAIEAAILGIDQHNQAGLWNLGLLQNSAVPSGFLVAEASELNPSGALSTDQRAQLKQEIENKFSGPRNSGRPMLLEGGVRWEQVSLNPKDMDWVNSRHTSARDIALAFGVPPMLLGIPGDNTFSNYKEANMAFYEQTVIPHKNSLKAWWNLWLLPSLDEKTECDFDKDEIDALAPKRAEIWDQTQKADFLTPNEKRDRLGYEPVEGGDTLFVEASKVPLQFANADPALSETTPAPGTPPNPNADPSEEDPSQDQPDAQGEAATSGKQSKIFNLKSQSAKTREWREVNRIRLKHERRLAKRAASIFREEGVLVADAIRSKSNGAAAFDAAEQVIFTNRRKMRSAISASADTVGTEFGKRVMNGLKSRAGAREAKDIFSTFAHHFAAWAENHVGEQIVKITDTTKSHVKKAVEKWQTTGEPISKLADDVESLYEGFAGYRADAIAITEVHAASSFSSLEGAKATGIPKLRKEWIFTNDKRTRDEHKLSGDEAIVGIDDTFSVGGEQLEAPGDPKGSPENVIRCRCTMGFLSEGDE